MCCRLPDVASWRWLMRVMWKTPVVMALLVAVVWLAVFRVVELIQFRLLKPLHGTHEKRR